jgi:predicted MFS family arabinose efflux permease
MRSGFRAITGALRHRDFAIYTAGSVVSLIGTWMQRVATGWLTWELTGSGAWLGVIAFADLFPAIVVGPLAGAAADRWDRLRVTKTTQSLALCQALALFALMVTGRMTIWLLCALSALGGIIAAFNQPARLALVPSLVPRPDLVSALAINSIVFNLARFIGPAVAGLMIVTTGLEGAFAANALTFAVFLVALSRLSRVSVRAIEGQGSFFAQVKEGIRYVAGHAGVAAILILSLVSSICTRPVVELLPGFAAEVFKSGADGLALLTSTVGIGAIGGGLWLGGRTRSVGLTRVVLASSFTMAMATVLFTATDRLFVAIPLLAAAGFCMSSAGIAAQTLVQLAVPGSMRGRVLSLYGLIFRGGPAIGALIMGGAAERLGFRWPVALGALVAAGASVWFLSRHGRLAGQLEQHEPVMALPAEPRSAAKPFDRS